LATLTFLPAGAFLTGAFFVAAIYFFAARNGITTPARRSEAALTFHEKAGRCQELFWLGKFISDVFLCPDIRRFVACCGGGQGRAQRVHLEP